MGLDSYQAARGRRRGLHTRLAALTVSTALATAGLTALTALTDPAAAAAAGSSIYVADGGAATAINTATDTVTANVPTSSGGDIEGVAYSPDGNTVYATEMGVEDQPPMTGLLAVINAATNSLVATIPVGVFPGPVAVTPDGGTVYVANLGSNTVSVVNTRTDKVSQTIPVGGVPSGLAVTPNGAEVYVTDSASGTVSVISTLSGTVTATIAVGGAPGSVVFSPDGAYAYVADSEGDDISMIAVTTNAILATIDGGSAPSGLAVSPDGRYLYVANASGVPGTYSQTISIIDTETNSVRATIPLGMYVDDVAVSPNGSTLYASGFTDDGPGSLFVINAATNQVTSTISGVASATAIAVAPGPKVSNVTPLLGTYHGGTTVTMTGAGFDGVTAVDFGGVPAASFTVNSSTSITAVSPPGPAEARVDLTVQAAAGVSADGPADQFTYIIVPTRPGPPVNAPIPFQGRE